MSVLSVQQEWEVTGYRGCVLSRSELGGFTAPLLLITILARHWGLKHKCLFKWLADSRTAINRVTVVTSPGYTFTERPENADYISVIQYLSKELRRPIQAHWIKSHQDSTLPYTALSPDAKLNVDVDELATKFHSKPKASPTRTTEHIPSTKISITILNTRYASNIDDNIRYHINGSYLRGHIQQLQN